MKLDYTMAYLRYRAGVRGTLPRPGAYQRLSSSPSRETRPLTETEARAIRKQVDDLLARVRV